VWSRFVRNFAVLAVDLGLVLAAPAASNKVPEDPDLLLQQIRSRTAEHLSQLPNYTCHQVVDRTLRRGSIVNHIDTVEFEVALVDHRELFARPGEGRFGQQTLGEMAPGTISDGVLGSQVDMLFASPNTEFRFAGTAKKDGHKTYRYDLSVPQESSGLRVKHDTAQAIVPFEGSVWVDVETLDLVRVDIKVHHIPAYVGVRYIEKSMHYQLMHIAGTDFLLPRNAELGAMDDLGNYSTNRVTLDQCREFAGESTIKYGSPTQGTASRERTDQRER
jgi:hypothetical protein